MWFGYLLSGARGALAVSVPFVVPPFLLATIVAVLYAQYQGLDAVHSVFLGVGPAVLAIIAIASSKLAQTADKRDPVLWTIAAILCVATAISGAEIVWLFLVAGAFGAVFYGGGLPRPSGTAGVGPLWLLASVKGLAWTGSGASLASLGWFFFKGRGLHLPSARAWRSSRSCSTASWRPTAG